MGEVRSIVGGMSDEDFWRRPVDEGTEGGWWSAGEVLAHLVGTAAVGTEEGGYVGVLRAALASGEAPVDFEREVVFEWESMKGMSREELLGLVEAEYGSMREFLAGLGERDLERVIFVPSLGETPLSSRPRFGALVEGLAVRHVEGHAKQLRRLVGGLAK